MNDYIKILLFDVDGVLVEPLAYKKGIKRTLEILIEQSGIADAASFLPEESEIAYMESKGIHDVWDMCNIMFALILCSIHNELCMQSKKLSFQSKFISEILGEIKAQNLTIMRPNYKAFVDKLALPEETSHPPDKALNFIETEIQERSKSAEERKAWKDLIGSFLADSRSAYNSHGTQLFQNIILGSLAFEHTYQLESKYSGASLLQTEDKVLLSAESAEKLKHASGSPLRIAVYTARPSQAPKDILESKGYSPEAEMAVQAAGLEQFPLVGMGMMEWLAIQHGKRTEDLTKPNTTHAIAALLAALTQSSNSSILELAFELDKNEQENPPALSVLKQMPAHVFVLEDTISGVKPMLAISERLRQKGYLISTIPLGIASDKNKQRSLEGLCLKVFTDVNQALDFALNWQPTNK